MSHVKDMTGMRFGNLVVLERDENPHSGDTGAWWFVQCDCGTIFSVYGPSLRRGLTRSCGCGITERENLIGRTFGDLTVERFDFTAPVGSLKWICRCKCGNTVVSTTSSLKSGGTTSCGCRHARESLIGKRFGRLVVVSEQYKQEWHNVVCTCRCDCGTITDVCTGNLTKGVTKSCGCLNRELIIARNSKYNSDIERKLGYRLDGMKERCYNPKHSSYPNYGGRGIYICDEWLNDSGAFVKWALENGFREDLSIDRIDNNGPYAPWNCRWTDAKHQANNSRHNVHLTINGETLTKSEWADRVGISQKRLHKRSVKDATKYVEEILKRQAMP